MKPFAFDSRPAHSRLPSLSPGRTTGTVNLGILAHVDAGKTTLTERLLYEAGVIGEIGSVDQGSTQTDTLTLERRRGITIKSAVVSFSIGDVKVNLIDTPGHPDFIAEVERVLNVLDGAVLVISAVEGVQPQTRVLMRALQRLRIPALLFVNKIDCPGASYERVLRRITERLTPEVIPMGWTDGLGTRAAFFEPYNAGDAHFAANLADVLADHDDAFLAAYLYGESTMSHHRLQQELEAQVKQAVVHPVFFGSAITGAGIKPLMAGIQRLLPSARGDADAPISGAAFKVERTAAGEKVAYVRMYSGIIRTRDSVQYGTSNDGKITAISVFDHGTAVPGISLAAGQIGKLSGLSEIKIGHAIGRPRVETQGTRDVSLGGYFGPPALESAVVPRQADRKGALRVALNQLAEQDPLINVRQDDVRGEIYVSLYGEVQKEVIQATLAEEYEIDVDFRETSVVCIERPIGTGEAVERLGKGGNPFVATIGLRVEPAPENAGIEVRLEATIESMPLYVFKSIDEFHRALCETARNALEQGISGWPVRGCSITLTECAYASPVSSTRDYRLLMPIVLFSALAKAGTQVCEPMYHFELEIPADTYGTTAPVLARLGAVLRSSTMRGSAYSLEGHVPAARVNELRQRLPAATSGEGVLEITFHRYRPVFGNIPVRPRSDHNPLNRKEYLLHVVRRV